MKCDELQYERLGDANKTYPASTLVIRKQFVDAAIAELKDENRRLKRALWLARAEKAKHIATFCYYALHYGRVPVREIYQCQDKWDKVECKCLAMAEEYK